MIPVCEPTLIGNEKRYALDCIETNWISSMGKYIEQFEQGFATFCGVKHAVAVNNGTTALHLALAASGIGSGDEVIVPTFTMIASVNAILYTGAKPVIVDADPETWNMDTSPSGIKKLAAKITKKTKAIMPVHIYGHPVDMDPILEIAKQHNQTRSFFYPMHQQPMFVNKKYPNGLSDADLRDHYPVADRLAQEGLYLPSSSHLTEEQIKTVVDAVVSLAKGQVHGG